MTADFGFGSWFLNCLGASIILGVLFGYKSVDISNLNQVVGTRSGQESIQKATEKSNKNNSQNSPKKQ